MGEVTVVTAIDTPAEEVWTFLTKINRYAKWDAFADEILSASASRLKFGATYEERSGTDHSSWKVMAFDPPRRQVHVGKVGFMGEVTREFIVAQAGKGAELKQTISFTIMPGFTRPFGWVAEKLFVVGMVRKRLTQSGAGLKAMLEAGEVG